MKRADLVPKLCSRCGNDLLNGKSVFNLPFEKKYIVFCGICHRGLNFPEGLFSSKSPTDEEWNTFWEEEV